LRGNPILGLDREFAVLDVEAERHIREGGACVLA